MSAAEVAACARETLVLPRSNLARMHRKPFRDVGERACVAHRGQSDIRLQSRGMVATENDSTLGLLDCVERAAGGARAPRIHPLRKTATIWTMY